MGNKPGGKKTILKVDNEEIILHNSYSMKLTLGEMQIFPHGLDGLKLWDAGIVLARYGILNPAYFKDKDVLELGAGVGIAGIAIQKWTQCKSITMTDYHEGVVSNIEKNMKKNQISQPAPIVFDWCKPEQLTTQFDVIIGSDIVYFGCPVKQLYSVFERLLRSGGRGLIIIPDRKNYAQLFTKQINKDTFDLEIEQLSNQVYFEPVLADEEKSQHRYPLLSSIKFYAYHLIKK